MRIFFDTNALLDVALRREPHFQRSQEVLTHAIERHSCYLSWHTVSNIAYIVEKVESQSAALEFIQNITKVCLIAPVEHKDLNIALDYNAGDLEDAMQIASALAVNADVIVTRDARGFAKSPITLIDPTINQDLVA